MTDEEKAVLGKMVDDEVDEAIRESQQRARLGAFTRVVVPMCFYALTPWCKPSLWRRITNFWSRVHFHWPVSFGED